jgi:hypothetical protein
MILVSASDVLISHKGEADMSLIRNDKKSTTRRGFVKEIAAGAAGAITAGAMHTAITAHSNDLVAASNPLFQTPAPGELKYRKYFTSELKPEELEIGYGALKNMFLVFCDDDIIEGCHFFSAMFMGESATKVAGHGPHKHRDPEVVVALGTDPDHPHELGAEFEVYMGPEMEKHVVNKPALIYIPPNFIHCPFRVTKVTRPFLFIDTQYSPKSVETPYKNLVPENMRDKYIFIESDGSSEKGKSRIKSKNTP